jgi:hypothetical protein
MLIDDRGFLSAGYMKYVNDMIVHIFSSDVGDMWLQLAANNLVKWLHTNGLVINVFKTKEMVIYFGCRFNKENDKPCNLVSSRVIECVHSFKLLGIYISSDLSWEFNVDYIIKKVLNICFG